MKQVAQMLGVEIGEIFCIKNRYYKYRLTEKSVEYYDGLNQQWSNCNYLLICLLNGEYEIIKIPKPILDDAERQYLSNVIKPFRHKVVDIYKSISLYDVYEYIGITIRDIDKTVVYMYFPSFKKGTMYKGMETGKKYSLEELEL